MVRPRIYSPEEYYRRNLDSSLRYKKRNRIRINALNRARKARLKGAEGSFTPADIQLILAEQANTCPGCLQKFTKDLAPTVDHFIPLNRSGTNYPENIQMLCLSCNTSKKDKLWSEWKAA